MSKTTSCFARTNFLLPVFAWNAILRRHFELLLPDCTKHSCCEITFFIDEIDILLCICAVLMNSSMLEATTVFLSQRFLFVSGHCIVFITSA